MRLSWRDGVETVLVGIVILAVVGVVQDRGWTLLGTDRAAVGTVFALGFVMCQVGMRSQVRDARDLVRGPFMRAATALGALALMLAVVGAIAPQRWIVVALGATLVATWAIATIHHAAGAPLVRSA
jgi:hypothetical protein